MTRRRFTDKPDLNPEAVRGLAEDHPAMRENRTLFPSTVVEVTAEEPERLLVSGANNRKLGATVEKGKFSGYALYALSLEERATCPDDCAVRSVCYGNGMQMARRHRIGDADTFYDRLAAEIFELLDQHDGLLVRLHVLGDFPSVEYVAFWADALEESPELAVYGYTARRTTAWGGDEIGDAIEAVKDKYPDRFRIRWSSPVTRPDGATVIDYVPDGPKVEEGVVCPAQTDATACCASCGLCWEPNFADQSIAFIRHGPKSDAVSAQTQMNVASSDDEGIGGVRPIRPFKLASSIRPAPIESSTPEVRIVAPTELLVEGAYQRDLSARSVSLIRKIVTGWDWTKFKPPVCADSPAGLYVIDGQHTALAAASHPAIKNIPVIVVQAPKVETRALAFVSHNRDRLAMSPFQIFHAEAAAGDALATTILDLAAKTGAIIPRSPPAKGAAKPGAITAITDIRNCLKTDGPQIVERIFCIAVGAQAAPLSRLTTRALRMLLTSDYFAAAASLPNSHLSNALKAAPDLEQRARAAAFETGQSADRAAAVILAEAASLKMEAA